jgi:hypothetical protein
MRDLSEGKKRDKITSFLVDSFLCVVPAKSSLIFEHKPDIVKSGDKEPACLCGPAGRRRRWRLGEGRREGGRGFG